jgi:hypothetical protein
MEFGLIRNISLEVPGKKGKERQGCGGGFLTRAHQAAHCRLQPAQATHNTEIVLSNDIHNSDNTDRTLYLNFCPDPALYVTKTCENGS